MRGSILHVVEKIEEMVSHEALLFDRSSEESAVGKIQTVCGNCGSSTEVRGLDWDALLKASVLKKDFKEVVVSWTCAPCRFRMSQATKEKTPAQKATRAAYNKVRNAEIREALELKRRMDKEGGV